MRSTDAGELTLLHSTQRSEGVKVEVIRQSDSSVVDLTSRVVSGSVSFSSDQRVGKCEVYFFDSFPTYNSSSSLSPLLSGSSYNSPSRLLWPNNEIKIYLGVDSLGSEVSGSELKLVFHGVLGDSIAPSGRKGDRRISISCRDLVTRLQNKHIKGEYLYGSETGTPVVSVLQGILNDNFTWNTNGDEYKKLHIKPTLDGNNNIDGCPFVVYPIKIGEMSVWDALNKVIGCTASDDIGYELRYTFLPSGDTTTSDSAGDTITISSDGFYLTLLEIDQSTSATDDSIDAETDSIIEHGIDISDDTIRNDIWGRYYDRFTGDFMELNRRNETSIADYGTRTMVIGQDDVPYIDTHEEMWNLLGVALNALKDVPATDGMTTQMMYHIEPNDLIDTTNARLATGSASVGIAEVKHEFATGRGGGPKTRQMIRTRLTGCRDRIFGSRGQHFTYSGDDDPGSRVGGSLENPSSNSSYYQGEQGGDFSKVTLVVHPKDENAVEYYEWKWAVEGTGKWETAITTEPIKEIAGLPPNKTVAWTARAKYKGGAK